MMMWKIMMKQVLMRWIFVKCGSVKNSLL
jgi:hypothetical protein